MTTLAEFKEIEAKATKGPFSSTFTSGKQRGVRAKGGFVCFLPAPMQYTGQDDRYEEELEENKSDAELIAISRTALPALIAVAEGMAVALYEASQDYDPNGFGRVLNKALAAFEAWKDNIEGEK